MTPIEQFNFTERFLFSRLKQNKTEYPTKQNNTKNHHPRAKDSIETTENVAVLSNLQYLTCTIDCSVCNCHIQIKENGLKFAHRFSQMQRYRRPNIFCYFYKFVFFFGENFLCFPLSERTNDSKHPRPALSHSVMFSSACAIHFVCTQIIYILLIFSSFRFVFVQMQCIIIITFCCCCCFFFSQSMYLITFSLSFSVSFSRSKFSIRSEL